MRHSASMSERVKSLSVSCQCQDVPGSDQSIALLYLGVTPAPPFAVSVLEHAGPLFYCDFQGKALYGAIHVYNDPSSSFRTRLLIEL